MAEIDVAGGEPASRRGERASDPPLHLEARTDHGPIAGRDKLLPERGGGRNTDVYFIEREAILLRRRRWADWLDEQPPPPEGDREQPQGEGSRLGISESDRGRNLDRYLRPPEADLEPGGARPSWRSKSAAWLRDIVVGKGDRTAEARAEHERACPPPPPDAPDVRDMVGLALSGGGVRSASFNLGILQGFASRNALWVFDYMSTVSGGGFIGSWWSAWLARERRRPPEIFPSPEELELQRRRDTAVLLSGDARVGPAPWLPDGSLVARRRDPIHFVRLFSNYLTPKTGAFSPDTWRLVAFYVRNVLLTWCALLPLLLTLVLLAQLFYLYGDTAEGFLCLCNMSCVADVRPMLERLWALVKLVLAVLVTLGLLWLVHSSARLWVALLGVAMVVAISIGMVMTLSTATTSLGADVGVLVLIVLVIAWHVLRAITYQERVEPDGSRRRVRATKADHRAWLTQQLALLMKWGTASTLLLLIAGFGAAAVCALFDATSDMWSKAGGWGGVLAAAVSAVYTVWKSAPSSTGSTARLPGALGRVLIAIAPPLVLLVLGLLLSYVAQALLGRSLQLHAADGVALEALLAGSVTAFAGLQILLAIVESRHDRAMTGDLESGWKRFVPILFLALAGGGVTAGEKRPWYHLFTPRGWARLAVLGGAAPLLFLLYELSWRDFMGRLESFPWSIAAVVILAGVLAVTFAAPLDAAPKSARSAVLLTLACVSAALCLLLATGVMASAGRPFVIGLLWAALLVGAVVGLGWLVDPNLLSMHSFYKARLTRAYLGASNSARENETITDAAPGDDLPLAAIWNHDSGAPYHLINATLSLVGGSDLSTSQRSAENFIMSRYHCGSARAGYRCTAEYMTGELSLGTAAAVSGAAISPTMGSQTPSAALALLLSLFNVRLGFWAPTPSGRRWNEPHARLWPFYLLRETLSNTGKIGTYCYLTDGGHFDNTGLYALVERGCRYIVLCDCGADPRLGFDDIGIAIRRCRIDFGAEIDLSIDQFLTRGRYQTSRTHVVWGAIRYQREHLDMLGFDAAADTGVVVWVKPSVTAMNAADVRQYRRAHADFPQQSTSDQWYDESQFESYRRLGYESARAAVDEILVTALATPGHFHNVGSSFSNAAARAAARQ